MMIAAGRALTLSASCLMLSACALSQKPDESHAPRSARIITREEIERSGAADGYEALKRAGSYLVLGERKSGDIRASTRGRSSIILSPQILLVVDEVVMSDLNSLRDIRADTIEWMKIMSGREATPIYGTPAANGVLVVKTRIPVDR